MATDLDRRLGELGATRAFELVKCDVAYDDDYASWKTEVFKSSHFASAAGSAQAPEPKRSDRNLTRTIRFSPPCLLPIVSTVKVRPKPSITSKSLSQGAGKIWTIASGDSLGVWPVNDAALVNDILCASGFSGRETVELKSGNCKLRSALLTKLDIVTAIPSTLETWQTELPFADAHIFDLIKMGVADFTPQKLVDGLRPLQPRLYSIASSPKKHPGEVHLTVGEVHYEMDDRAREGVASLFLGKRLPMGGSLGVYVQRSGHFHLPQDDTTPVIMIGPGTGIAPFHAFVEEREMRGATGKNWLFFGDQHEATDYLYKDELENWKETGLLTNLSLAWSRDGADKVYVQHLIEKEGRPIF